MARPTKRKAETDVSDCGIQTKKAATNVPAPPGYAVGNHKQTKQEVRAVIIYRTADGESVSPNDVVFYNARACDETLQLIKGSHAEADTSFAEHSASVNSAVPRAHLKAGNVLVEVDKTVESEQMSREANKTSISKDYEGEETYHDDHVEDQEAYHGQDYEEGWGEDYVEDYNHDQVEGLVERDVQEYGQDSEEYYKQSFLEDQVDDHEQDRAGATSETASIDEEEGKFEDLKQQFMARYPQINPEPLDIWEHFNEDREPKLELSNDRCVDEMVTWAMACTFGTIRPTVEELFHMRNEKRYHRLERCTKTLAFKNWTLPPEQRNAEIIVRGPLNGRARFDQERLAEEQARKQSLKEANMPINPNAGHPFPDMDAIDPAHWKLFRDAHLHFMWELIENDFKPFPFAFTAEKQARVDRVREKYNITK